MIIAVSNIPSPCQDSVSYMRPQIKHAYSIEIITLINLDNANKYRKDRINISYDYI